MPLLAHDFVEHPDGTLAAIVVEERDFQGAPLRGDKIVEIAPDGDADARSGAPGTASIPPSSPGDDPAMGWTFANALDYDPVADVYYLGMRNFSSIARINRDRRRL